MGTAEILIVFSALMALIALVTIGIDWIGKPLKSRRFIPRIYRFDDEKLPVDAYGHTNFGEYATPEPAARQAPVSVPRPQRAKPRQVANRSAGAATAFTKMALPRATAGPAAAVSAAAASAATAPAHAPAALPAHTQTAFSDSLAPVAAPAHDTIAGTGAAPVVTPTAPWQPGMPLDTTVDDRKPSLAAKAERFWMTAAGSLGSSHFDVEDLARMGSGKAPRRTNPRTGKAEAMQLTGLRRASAHSDVRMRWPDDAVDPWNAS